MMNSPRTSEIEIYRRTGVGWVVTVAMIPTARLERCRHPYSLDLPSAQLNSHPSPMI